MSNSLKKAFVGGAAFVAAAAATLNPGSAAASTPPPAPLIKFREYQKNVFLDHHSKTVILHWSRQTGKSFTLAGWAVKRLLDNPGRLVTVLSNSRPNGEEFVLKCHEICHSLAKAMQVERLEMESNNATLDKESNLSEDEKFALMHAEVRITVKGRTGRIIVLAANPRTARGFSGDLILDEFAFHEDSRAIWEAAEPIISSNRDFLCRIASTGNGKRNMFYQLISEGRIPYYRLRRSDAWRSGELKIYSSVNNREITPDQAEAESSDKGAYRQNYECEFNDEASVLLSQELINIAQRSGLCTIEKQAWSEATIARLARIKNPLYLGQDVARHRDLSVQTVVEKDGQNYNAVAILCIENTRLPDQQKQLQRVCELPNLRAAQIDMTGLGLGLVEYAQENKVWGHKVHGTDFSTTEATTKRIQAEGRKAPTAKVTEIMATELLAVFEDRRITIPADATLRDDLRKPEKVVSPGGRVSIAAARDAKTGHADFFWSLALSIRAAGQSIGPAVATTPARATSTPQRALGRLLGITRAGRRTLCRLAELISGRLPAPEKAPFLPLLTLGAITSPDFPKHPPLLALYGRCKNVLRVRPQLILPFQPRIFALAA